MDIRDVQERWLDAKDEYDAQERSELEAEARAREQAAQPQPREDDEFDGDLDNFRGSLPDSGVKVIRKS
ncbi:hypothetical protein CNMCM6106_000555 [Aspergillus hiratsukae]|nr:hypothetical protein CNMCM6106_000555 [Aspergillus hiratsukae]